MMINDRRPDAAGDPALVVPLLRQVLQAVEDLRCRLDGQRKELYTVEEIARLTGRSAYTVRRWISEGRLRAIRVDGTGPRGRLLVPGDQLDQLLPQGLGDQLSPITIHTSANRPEQRP